MPFSVSWHTLLDELEELPEGSTLITPLSHKRFRVTDTQEHRVIIEFEDNDETRPLQRDQFETLNGLITAEIDQQKRDVRFGEDGSRKGWTDAESEIVVTETAWNAG